MVSKFVISIVWWNSAITDFPWRKYAVKGFQYHGHLLEEKPPNRPQRYSNCLSALSKLDPFSSWAKWIAAYLYIRKGIKEFDRVRTKKDLSHFRKKCILMTKAGASLGGSRPQKESRLRYVFDCGYVYALNQS